MKEKIYRFMIGRNGVDELARTQSMLSLILMLIGVFTRVVFFAVLALVLMVYMYFRIFSRNTAKRYEENQKYINFRYRIVVAWNKFTQQIKQRKNYRFFKCPMCHQKVRVPKGHGKIEITCPKCREKFIRKS